MATITSIEQQKKDKTRCSIFIDGRFYCGIKLEVAVKYRLKEGMQIEKSELDQIQLETEKSTALDRALTHISATMKTEKQMRDFLYSKGYTRPVADYVMERLQYYGFVDDYAYCKAYIEGVKSKGKRAIELDLIKRGAAREAIDRALGETEESLDCAFETLLKYMRGKPADRQNLLKGYKYLLSRGYDADIAKAALARLGETDEDY